MKNSKSILAAIDFSESTDCVIRLARSMGEALGVPVNIVHAAAPDPAFVGNAVGPQSVRDGRAHELREEHGQLAEIAEGMRLSGCETHAMIVEGATAETILDLAERTGAGMIILGSHGRGALAKAALGSASEAVIRAATCPVLVVPRGYWELGSDDAAAAV
jgi:nucleotide-binding universal stress UspA family protein